VTVEEGEGSVVNVRRREVMAPGLVQVQVKMGLRRGIENVFLVKCGEAQTKIYIVGQ